MEIRSSGASGEETGAEILNGTGRGDTAEVETKTDMREEGEIVVVVAALKGNREDTEMIERSESQAIGRHTEMATMSDIDEDHAQGLGNRTGRRGMGGEADLLIMNAMSDDAE